MRSNPNHRRQDRGTTILETMIALTVLLIGATGLIRLQVFGLATTQGARAYTTAQELARELASGLEQLQYSDTRLSAVATADATPPARFGSLLGVTDFTDVHSTTSGTLPPGVRPDAELEGGSAAPLYVRRWAVWDYLPTGGVGATKFVAVSVIYHERSIQRDREVTMYLSRSDTGALMANAAAFR